MEYCRTYNQIIDVADITEASGVITEPVSLAEMKNFLRLEGFEDDVESGEVAFTSDDELITELITASRQRLEKYCGISIVNHRWSVLLTNLAGNVELPYSNGFELISIKDCKDEDIVSDNYKLRGAEVKILGTPLQENVTIVYDAGYENVPKALKQAIMRDVAFHYENRNDVAGELAHQAIVLASPYKRVSTWLA